MLWRLPGDDPRKGVGVFAFVSAAPSDRNAADFYVHGAINFMGLWDKRPDDAFGVAAAYSPVSPAVSALDAQSAYFARAALPIRNYEMALEVSYQAPILPGWLIQPDFQYIFHPRYGAIDPINPALGRIRDAAVFGLHTAIKF
ncbi:Porin (fragment) [Methylocella tundrae]